MTVINLVVFTAAQRTTAMQGGTGWGAGKVTTDPRPIDNSNPGVGINLNPDATDYPNGGEVVTLAGRYVANKRMVDDPEYLLYAPDLVAYLLTLPWCMLESETIFAPYQD